MTLYMRIALIIGVIIYLCIILNYIKKDIILLKYALLWLLSAFILLIMAIFPEIIYNISDFLGFVSPSNAIFLVFIFFILLILISLTCIVTTEHNQIKTLTQSFGIMEKDIEDLKKMISENNA